MVDHCGNGGKHSVGGDGGGCLTTYLCSIEGAPESGSLMFGSNVFGFMNVFVFESKYGSEHSPDEESADSPVPSTPKLCMDPTGPANRMAHDPTRLGRVVRLLRLTRLKVRVREPTSTYVDSSSVAPKYYQSRIRGLQGSGCECWQLDWVAS